MSGAATFPDRSVAPAAAAQRASAPLLEVRDIEKSFPGVRALSGVSFDVVAGEVHALLGENGAGKSTLIKTVSGVFRPDRGAILVDGEAMDFQRPADARRAGVATIYQELLLFPELTVAENIFMGHAPRAALGRLDWRAMRARAEDLLASLEIHDLAADRIVGTLSVGNRQRVEILRALSQNARLLIMDEPTAALTEHDVARLFSTVRLLKSRGVGIIYISHRMDEIFAIGDRVTVLRDGAHVGTRRVAQTTSGELVQMMVGRKIDNLFPKVTVSIGEPILETHNLVRRPMTKSISLTVRAGEIVGLAGLVGSGRSEFAQTVFGVTPAELGEIRLAGAPVKIGSPGAARELGVAYVPEDRGVQGLVRAMSVLQNFSLSGLSRLSRAGFIDRAAERRLAEEGVARFSVKTSSLDQIAGRLSGGNQQKIVLGKWLANNPRLLILDEPTRGIDVGAKAEIHRLMGELAGKGLAILMISSELPEVLGMSDRVLVMREGRLVAEFDRPRATAEAVGAAMMGDDGKTGEGGVSAVVLSRPLVARTGLLRRLASQEALLAIAVIALALAVGLVNPRFLATRNLADVLLGNAYIAVAAIGMSMVIISGNIDISVGALIGVLATISGSLAVAGVPVAVAWLAPVVIGVAVMALQGAVIAYLRIPAIVVTLGMLSILKGGLISVTGGRWISDLPDSFHLADIELFDVLPMPVLMMVVATALAAYWMRYSSNGRAIYATGGNPEAARLCGVSPPRVVVMVFALHGFFAAIAALLFATQLKVIQSTVPPNLELTIITASVVGGVSILGGVGTVIGATLAAILIAEIASALVFINVSPYWIHAVQGTLILVTVIADILRRQRRKAGG